jgi:hypothetical protein
LQERLYIEAEQLARMAVHLSPEDSKSHLYLSVAVGKLALYEGGRRKVELSKETKVEAERAVALNPNEDVGYHVLTIWHREMVELAEAKTELEQALRMPRTWATNEYYWELARRKLEDLSAQLNR